MIEEYKQIQASWEKRTVRRTFRLHGFVNNPQAQSIERDSRHNIVASGRVRLVVDRGSCQVRCRRVYLHRSYYDPSSFSVHFCSFVRIVPKQHISALDILITFHTPAKWSDHYHRKFVLSPAKGKPIRCTAVDRSGKKNQLSHMDAGYRKSRLSLSWSCRWILLRCHRLPVARDMGFRLLTF